MVSRPMLSSRQKGWFAPRTSRKKKVVKGNPVCLLIARRCSCLGPNARGRRDPSSAAPECPCDAHSEPADDHSDDADAHDEHSEPAGDHSDDADCAPAVIAASVLGAIVLVSLLAGVTIVTTVVCKSKSHADDHSKVDREDYEPFDFHSEIIAVFGKDRLIPNSAPREIQPEMLDFSVPLENTSDNAREEVQTAHLPP